MPHPLAAVPRPAAADEPLAPASGMVLGGMLGALGWLALLAWWLS